MHTRSALAGATGAVLVGVGVFIAVASSNADELTAQPTPPAVVHVVGEAPEKVAPVVEPVVVPEPAPVAPEPVVEPEPAPVVVEEPVMPAPVPQPQPDPAPEVPETYEAPAGVGENGMPLPVAPPYLNE